jgi:hypothetical protein
MSRNVDFVRSIYKDWERGQFDLLGWAHAEIEFVVVDGPQPMRLRGLRAMLQHWREFLRAWDGSGIAVDEYRQLDEHRVLVLVHAGHDRAGASGLEPQRSDADGGAQVFDIRDATVTRLATYFERERALSDLRLEE